MTTPREQFQRHVAWTSHAPMALEVDRAEGPYIWLTDGRRLTDLISGIAVSSLGHRHEAVLAAIRRQLDRHLHVMVYGEFIQEAQSALAALLASVLPGDLSSIYFTMSGTEANEGALKLAKKATGRTRLVAFDRSYHGDTHGSLSVTGRSVYREPFLPLLPDVTFLPFDRVDALDAIDNTVAAVITEPIQGEGGVRVPSRAWHEALRDRCTEVGALLIFDEIQTGMGRTGTLFAAEQFGVVPDIITLAKALGGGMPIGAFASRPEIMGALRENPSLSHVTTFGGHPVSCAAAHAALEVLVQERLHERAPGIEARVRKALHIPGVVEVRGMGAMLGMVLSSPEETARVVSACLADGVLLGWTLHSDTLVRIAPPLNIPNDTLDAALEIIRQHVGR
ncbi:MAG: aspartate aminotransferase family protein [Bacteroidetes bacterium CG12_big_fil_rev_8_21_14_0_65_60_17]|nr:MAG: aspartate aminotransferase family protein [Bacteroidetes bacterium CG12_big_fil_rev_8_21_14_0_65_60_17]